MVGEVTLSQSPVKPRSLQNYKRIIGAQLNEDYSHFILGEIEDLRKGSTVASKLIAIVGDQFLPATLICLEVYEISTHWLSLGIAKDHHTIKAAGDPKSMKAARKAKWKGG